MALPTLVQQNSNTAISAGTVTVTMGSATTIGNTLIVCAAGGNNSLAANAVSTVKIGGSADNFAKSVGTTTGTGPGTGNETWTDPGLTVSSTSVVVSWASGQSDSIALVMEWANLGASPLDKTNDGTASAASGGNWSSGSSGTLTQTNELIVGSMAMMGDFSPSLTTPGSPWTELTQVTTSAGTWTLYLAVGYQVVSSTSAVTYNGTDVNLGSGVATIATFKGKPQGGPMLAFPF